MIKKLPLVLLFLCAFFLGFGQVSESFDGLTKIAYGNYTYNGFQLTNALCNSTNARSGNAVRLRDAGTSLEYIGLDGNGKDGGAGDISFWYRSWDSSPAAVFDVEVSVNGGAYTTIGTQINTTSTSYGQWSHSLNNTSENIKVRISRVSGERLHIDDFEITDFSCTDAVDFERLVSPTTSPLTITQGNPLTVTTLATEPGVTGVAGGAPGLEAWIGYSSTDNDPSTSNGWTWVDATYIGGAGNTDEHSADIGSGLAPGTYYYASRHRLNGCTFTYGGNVTSGGFWNNNSQVLIVEATQVDWCNLQNPSSGSGTLGGNYWVDGYVWEDGVTNPAGQGANIEAWIGYSTTDAINVSDFSSGWTWVPASYYGDSGNNDQYQADIISGTNGITSAGTYYYVSRFQLNGSSSPFSYGGTNSDGLGDGDFWDGTNYVSGVLTVDLVDWCNLQNPSSGTGALGGNFWVDGYVWEDGVTNPAGQGANIEAWIGYSTTDATSVSDFSSGWTWVPASYYGDSGNNDQYHADIISGTNGITSAGTYYYVSRFQLNGSSSPFSYGGTNSDGLGDGNFWDGSNYVSGVLTVRPPNDFCSGAISLAANTTCSFTSYSNVNATDSGISDPGCANYQGGDVWFSVVVPASGEITVETSDNGGISGTGIALYSGTCGSLSLITCDDNGGAGNMSLINETGLTVGSTLYIRVWEYGNNDFDTFDICVTSPPLCTEPLAQPTSLTLNNVTYNSIDGSFTASATADNYLVIASTSSTLSGNPVDTSTYTVGSALGGGTVVAVGPSTTFTYTGLNETTQYYFFVFAFNNNGCGGGPIYLTSGPLTGDETTLVEPCLTTGFENSDGWGNHSGGDWTDNTPDGAYISNGCFADGGNTNSGTRKVGLNDVGDWLELPPVDNPTSLNYYARLSSAPSATNSLTIQYYNGSSWIDIVVHTATSATYELFTADLSSIAILTNVRLRFYRNADNRSHYIDDLSVYCGSPISAAELQLVDDSSSYQDCGYSIDFGAVSTVMTSDITFDILNLGNEPLTVSSLGITGDFSVNPSIGSSIAAGESETYTITFAPQSVGTLNGTLTITSTNDYLSDENSCTIALTGTGYTGVPEIRVERNTNANIPDGVAPNIGYNTIFAQTIEGNDSDAKTYYIRNEGDGDLEISSIALSNTEFELSSIPPGPYPITISPGDAVPFEIIFSPNTAGLKTATLTIANNDDPSDGDSESPFTFDVEGNALCAGSSITIFPSSGPIGTIVTVSGADFGSMTSASIGGESATNITVISSTVIEIEIPAGADTSNLIINDDAGCFAQEIFTVYTDVNNNCDGSTSTIPADWTDLLISGVFDNGTGSCHYLELFNPTGTDIILTGDYKIGLSNNFATANDGLPVDGLDFTFNGTEHFINGTIPAYSTFMIRFGNTGDSCNDCPSIVPDDTIEASAFGINGNAGTPLKIDRIIIFQESTNDYIDLWANIEYANPGYIYTRNTTSSAPSMTYSNTDWTSSGTADCFGFEIEPFFDGPQVTELVAGSPSCNVATFSVIGTEGYDVEPGDIRELDYDWYYFDPLNATLPNEWILLSDGGIYSGTNTGTLTIDDASSVSDFQFYCRVKEDDNDCYIASIGKKAHIPTTTWDGGSWDNGAPDIDTIAIIDGNYNTLTNNDIEACNLIVNKTDGSGDPITLTISDNFYVLVQNNATINGNIIVSTSGSFVQVDDAGTFSLGPNGTAKVEKLTASMNQWYEYTYWSSPIEDETIEDALSEASSNRRFWFNAQNYRDSKKEQGNSNTYTDGQDDVDDDISDGTGTDWTTASGIMQPGVGYASTHSSIGFNSIPCSGGPGCQFKYTFEGTFNTGTIDVPIYRNDNEMLDNNWNFLGNPYPSAIDADLFLNANTIDNAVEEFSPNGVTDGAIFFWSQKTPPSNANNGNQQENFSQDDYAIINTLTQTAGGDELAPTRHIPSGQGFFISYANVPEDTDNVQISASPKIIQGTVTFTNSMRVTGYNDQFFKNTSSKKENRSKNILKVNLNSDNGVFNQLAIAYVDNATNGYDGMAYDTPRNLSSALYSSIYTTIEGNDKKFAIQGRNSSSLTLDEIITLGFDTSINEATLYTLSIASIEGDFFTANDVYIVDYLLNTSQSLKSSGYTFTSETGEFNDRFEIVFTPKTLSNPDFVIDSNSLSIIELSNGNVKFKVPSHLEMESIEILDLLGRTIYKFNTQGYSQVFDLSRLSLATYIARVKLSNGYTFNKKAIKRQ